MSEQTSTPGRKDAEPQAYEVTADRVCVVLAEAYHEISEFTAAEVLGVKQLEYRLLRLRMVGRGLELGLQRAKTKAQALQTTTL
jgi:hypothetical protein